MGLIKGIQPIEITAKSNFRPHQYPLKPEAEEGGCYNSLFRFTLQYPAFSSPPSSGWRMVQDLQAVNRAVVPRAPTVPDPHTLLNDLRPKTTIFSVVDISNALFSISAS